MGKLIAVDFKKKRVEFTLDDKRYKEVERLRVKLNELLAMLYNLEKTDRRFQNSCAIFFGNILLELKEK